MKRLVAAVFFLVAVSSSAFAQFVSGGSYDNLYDSETVAMLREHVEYLASAELEGRGAGTEGETLAARYLAEQLEACGVDMLSAKDGDIFGIDDNGLDTLVSRNVFGFIQGYDKKLRDRYVVIGARLDNLGMQTMTVNGQLVNNIYFGANGNASGLAMMIELARKISTNRILFRKSVIFVAFGASAKTMAGSWYFLNRSFSDVDNIDMMINLDMLGTASNGFYAFTSSNAELNEAIRKVSDGLQPIRPEITAAEPYPSDHRAFYAKEIPSVLFTTGRYQEHNTNKDTPSIVEYDDMEMELEYIYNFTLAQCSTERKISFKPEGMAKEPQRQDVVSYYDCDVRPAFLNSTDPATFLTKWVYQYLRYPEEAIQNGIQGTVQVNFVIEKDGKVTEAKVLKGVDPLLDQEALRVVNASPKWRPAKVRGEKVRSSMTIPVEFKLVRKGDRKKIGIKR